MNLFFIFVTLLLAWSLYIVIQSYQCYILLVNSIDYNQCKQLYRNVSLGSFHVKFNYHFLLFNIYVLTENCYFYPISAYD